MQYSVDMLLSARGVFETIYFISGPAVALVGYLALKQIKIAKTDISIRVRREALLLAVQQCDIYAKIILPELRDLKSIEGKTNVPCFDKIPTDFNYQHLKKEYPIFIDVWEQKIENNYEACVKASDTCNKLEAMAMYFVNGLADEKIAYDPLAINYCAMITRLYPWICVSRYTNGDIYKNLIKLYETWKSRLDTDKINKELLRQMITQASMGEKNSCTPIVGLHCE